jgi:hypothetical protein
LSIAPGGSSIGRGDGDYFANTFQGINDASNNAQAVAEFFRLMRVNQASLVELA